jgi:hypothetical protein
MKDQLETYALIEQELEKFQNNEYSGKKIKELEIKIEN